MATPILNDQVLADAEQKLESQLLPDVRQDYMKIVVAGMRVALHGGPNGMLAGLKNKSKDPIHDAAVGAINLCLLLRHTAPAMPIKAMIPAAMTLMFHALDFVDKTGLAKVGPDELVRATHIFTNRVMQAWKVTPQMLQHAAGVVHGVMQDPNKMDALARKTGVVKHPMASEPTDLPQEAPQPAGSGIINQGG